MSAPTPWPPSPATAAPRRRHVGRGLLGAAVAIAVPWGWSTSQSPHLSWRMLSIAVPAAILIALTRDRWWPVRWALAASAAWAIAASVSRAPALLFAPGALLADWVCQGRAPGPFVRRFPPRMTAAPVVLLLVTAWQASRDPSPLRPTLLLMALTFVVTAAAVWRTTSLERVNAAIGRAAGSLVGHVGFALLWVPVVLVPWCWRRPSRLLARRRAVVPASTWVRRVRRDRRVTEPWAPEPVLALPTPRWGRRIAMVAAVAIVAGVVVTDRYRVHETLADVISRSDEIPAAVDTPWYPEYREVEAWFFQVGYQPLDLPRIKDVRSRYLNIVDGVRQSWTPPACECRRLTVWLYGGSAAFGQGQRDDHTIASELARAAWEEGIVVDVVNRGIPGDLHWLEAQRFAWDAAFHGPPDLVLFYDGWNDLTAVLHLGEHFRRLDPIDPPRDRARDLYWEHFGTPEDADRGPGGARLLPPPPGDEIPSTPELAAAGVERYDRERGLSRTTASYHDVPIVWFWQPTIYQRPRVEGEPRSTDEGEAWSAEFWISAQRSLPDDVVDLSDSLDHVLDPVFYDEVHTNELGARVVAEAILDEIRPRLLQLRDT